MTQAGIDTKDSSIRGKSDPSKPTSTCDAIDENFGALIYALHIYHFMTNCSFLKITSMTTDIQKI